MFSYNLGAHQTLLHTEVVLSPNLCQFSIIGQGFYKIGHVAPVDSSLTVAL